MKIGSRDIGRVFGPYVIAEIGVNHDGTVERALELVDAAARAGADAVKLQLFSAEMLMSKEACLAAYQRAAGEADPFDMLRRLEMSVDQMSPIVAGAHEAGIHAIVSVFSVELVGEAQRLPWDAYKTASPDIVNRPLLEALAQTMKPLIVSTGTATLDEVERAVRWVPSVFDRLALLQCVSSYPTPPDRAALGGIAALAEVSPGPVGYSDHTSAVETGGLAVAAGASMLEKHLTYSRTAVGPDHAASLDPAAFAEYVRGARRAHTMLGPARKIVLDVEREVRGVSRQSLTVTRDLPAGHRLVRADLTLKRPGTGIEPWRMGEVVGRILERDVERNRILREQDLRGG